MKNSPTPLNPPTSAPHPLMRKWIEWVIKHRKTVVALTLVATVAFVSQLRSLQILIDPDLTLPQSHPYIVTNNLVEKIFGNKFLVVIAVHPEGGNVYQPEVLKKVQAITQGLAQAPGVVRGNINSLAGRKAKDITGNAEGMVVKPLMEKVPTTPAELERLAKAVAANPIYPGLLVSNDLGSTLITAEFKKVPGGFRTIADAVESVVAPQRDASVQIDVGGLPIFLALLEKFSARMGFLFPIAVLLIGLIHFEAFRTLQALVLPLVTALLAVAWAVGLLSALGQPLDVFNSSTPILILALAAGHAVQILKRYYEEYSSLAHAHPELTPVELSHRAVVESLSRVGPVMAVACAVAAIGFFSLVIFEIKSIRTFGIFTGSGVLSALVLELTFIPALRAMIKPPGVREIAREKEVSIWDRIVSTFYVWSTERRRVVYAASGIGVALLALGGAWLKIENSQKSYFSTQIAERNADDRINARMAGTNSLYVMFEGAEEDAIKDPAVLKAMEQVQRRFEENPIVGKTVSIVDFLKKMNQSMNAGDSKFFRIPESRDLVAQYLLLYSTSGDPGDFDSYVDYGYQRALVQGFIKTDSSSTVDRFARELKVYAQSIVPPGIQVSVGGGSTGGVALNEVMIREKVLNILQIMGAVFLVSTIVFRSFLAGALIIVPLVAAVAVNFGVMGLLGIPLQIATALVSAMAVGIGADYGIYMSYRLREELRKPGPEEQAIKRAFQSAGKAALFVSSAVAGGFGMLMLSWGFMVHIWMGFLIALAMLVSSITALTLFPSLVFSLRPRFIFEGRTKPDQPKENSMSRPALSPAVWAFVCLGLSAALASPTHAAPSAIEIAERAFAVSKVKDSIQDATFTLTNEAGQTRTRKTTGKTRLIDGTVDNRRITRFVSPPDVKGTVTLLVEHSQGDDDLWIYLPALKKVRRLVASNKKDSFVGTDFSYGDVIGHKVADWKHALVREETYEGRAVYVLEATPIRPEVGDNTGYSKRVSWIDKESFVALKVDYYDLGGPLLKTYLASKVQLADAKDKKYQPMRIETKNVQTNHSTVIEFDNYKANAGVPEAAFATRAMERDQ